MGRTNRTFRDLLRAMEQRWGDYRRVLRRGDQPRFDRLFTYAREHADAASYLNHETPQFPVLVGIDLEQERRLDELDERFGDLDERLRAVERDIGVEVDAEVEPADAAGEDPPESATTSE